MSDLAVILGGLVALVLGVLGFGQVQKREGRKEAESDAIQDDLETAKRIDAVRSLDVDAARERLLNRKPSGDL